MSKEERKWYREIFQSTSLSRGKTFIPGTDTAEYALSIHFPLTRED